jgi:ribosomal protein L37AE/L43A
MKKSCDFCRKQLVKNMIADYRFNGNIFKCKECGYIFDVSGLPPSFPFNPFSVAQPAQSSSQSEES